MRRMVLLVTVGLIMAAMLVASAMPAFAKAERDEWDVSLAGGDLTSKSVETPSGRVNGHAHYRPAEPQGGGGGGATLRSAGPGELVEIAPNSDALVAPNTTAKGVETPSGNFNTTGHGEYIN